MIEETGTYICRTHSVKIVGLLATTGTLKSRLYHDTLETIGLRVVSPLDLTEGDRLQRELVMEPIYGPFREGRHQGGGIKSVGPSAAATQRLEDAAARLIESSGAEIIIAGCTEIPLALSDETVSGVPAVDPTRVLARAAIREAYGMRSE